MATTLNLNINSDGDDDLLYIWQKWNFKPSKISLFGPLSKNGLWKIKNVENADLLKIIKNSEFSKEGESVKYFINMGAYFMSFVQLYDSDVIQVINFYYDPREISHDDFSYLVNEIYEPLRIEDNTELKDVIPCDYYEAVYDNNIYSLAQKNLSNVNISLDLSYCADVVKKHAMVFKKIEQNENGIITMFGPEGSGKTYYLSYLIKQLNMQVILCPTILFDNIWNLNMFLSWVKKHKDIILVFEDCEYYLENSPNKKLIIDIIKQSMNGLDAIGKNIYFIMTFNTDAEKNPLSELSASKNILDYRFQELNVKQANKLALKIKKQAKHTKSVLLKDVYANNIKKTKTNNTLGY